MTNWELLDKKIEESGLRRAFIYERLGITRSAWSHKRSGRTDFTASQIQTLCEVLHITRLSEKEQIFFARQ